MGYPRQFDIEGKTGLYQFETARDPVTESLESH